MDDGKNHYNPIFLVLPLKFLRPGRFCWRYRFTSCLLILIKIFDGTFDNRNELYRNLILMEINVFLLLFHVGIN